MRDLGAVHPATARGEAAAGGATRQRFHSNMNEMAAAKRTQPARSVDNSDAAASSALRDRCRLDASHVGVGDPAFRRLTALGEAREGDRR